MKKSVFKVLGVMSGTSLDGIDLAVVVFTKSEAWQFKIEIADTVPYSKKWRNKLTEALNYEEQQLKNINKEYTVYLAEVINSFKINNKLKNLDAVCSHGHTVKHEPENRYTLQIGNLPELANLVNERVVCDFRVQDVVLGGQGAPLVPIGDELLFHEFDYCLNLGGFANISTEKIYRIAYDICPVNTVLNFYAEKLGFAYDDQGKIARDGELNTELLEKLQQLEFYKKKPPKSLGIEWVNAKIFPILREYEDDIPSILRTYSQHVALQIVQNVDNNPSSKLLITGGGCFNTFLIESIQKRTKAKVILPSEEIINYKEALIFGLLGVLKLLDENNVLSSVTGASHDHSSGVIFEP